MEKHLITAADLNALGDTIREKLETNKRYKVREMADAIASLNAGIIINEVETIEAVAEENISKGDTVKIFRENGSIGEGQMVTDVPTAPVTMGMQYSPDGRFLAVGFRKGNNNNIIELYETEGDKYTRAYAGENFLDIAEVFKFIPNIPYTVLVYIGKDGLYYAEFNGKEVNKVHQINQDANAGAFGNILDFVLGGVYVYIRGSLRVGDIKVKDNGAELYPQLVAAYDDRYLALFDGSYIKAYYITYELGENNAFSNVSLTKMWENMPSNIGVPKKMVYNNDGTRLVCVGESGVAIYDTSSSYPINWGQITDPTIKRGGYDGCFSGDGTRFALTTNKNSAPYFVVYNTTVTPWEEVSEIVPPPAMTAQYCAFNPDGSRLAVSCADAPYIYVFDTSMNDAGYTVIKANNSKDNAFALGVAKENIAENETGEIAKIFE